MNNEEAYFKPDPRNMIPIVYADTMEVTPVIDQMDREYQSRVRSFVQCSKDNPMLTE